MYIEIYKWAKDDYNLFSKLDVGLETKTPKGFIFADINADQKDEIITLGGVVVTYQESNYSVQKISSYFHKIFGNDSANMVAVDFNLDGKDELVVIGPCNNKEKFYEDRIFEAYVFYFDN